jgi:hypothetical protein
VAVMNFERPKELRALQDKERDGVANLVSRLLAEMDSGEGVK